MSTALAAALVVLLPGVASACATCVSSAFGDRTYNWAYFGLVLMPFALTATVGGIIAVRMGWRPRTTVKAWCDRSRLSHVKAWVGEISLFSDRSTRREDAPRLASPLPAKKHEETT